MNLQPLYSVKDLLRLKELAPFFASELKSKGVGAACTVLQVGQIGDHISYQVRFRQSDSYGGEYWIEEKYLEEMFTDEMLTKMQLMYERGNSYEEIAAELDRPRTAIDYRLGRMREQGIIRARSTHRNGHRNKNRAQVVGPFGQSKAPDREPPQQTDSYEEDGHTVKVYESRAANGLDPKYTVRGAL